MYSRCWRSLVCAGLFSGAVVFAAAFGQETHYFRIGTAATGGSFFEIGGIVAGAISSPAEAPDCEHGGSCGVRGLVAVAQATPGSVENLRLINDGQIESGFAQADLAGWAQKGIEDFAASGPMPKLRALASLFPEAAHLVVRADSPIRSLADLAGKRVSLGEAGSGTAADARVLLAAAGLGGGKVRREYLRPGPAAEQLKEGGIDALFLVGGPPVPAIRDLAASTPVRLVPLEGQIIDALKKDFGFYHRAVIPAGAYPGIDSDTPSLGFYALWLINADIDADLVYAICKSLWSEGTAKLLAKLDRVGQRIRLDRALTGVSVPLHPGAERFYRETGLPVDSATQPDAREVKDK
ncbi:MAG TPA: TAXI family TRAP transporter solute-binding subunit [Stellaceae bacterium]